MVTLLYHQPTGEPETTLLPLAYPPTNAIKPAPMQLQPSPKVNSFALIHQPIVRIMPSLQAHLAMAIEHCWNTMVHALSPCYRCLGPSTFFLASTLSTIPHPVGHDYEWQRDLFRDLGPVCSWQCFKHCFLKAKFIASFFLTFIFHFKPIYLLISMITPPPLSHNHAYCYVLFPLTLIDIASLAAFSLCATL